MKLHVEQYFGKWLKSKDATLEVIGNARLLVAACNKLIGEMEFHGVVFRENPFTQSLISGETLGGFRPQDCALGAPKSAHKQGLAVDLYDPDNKIDGWLYSHQSMLKEFGLYFEHPVATNTWSHWTIRKPKSGHRFFYP